jgi:hypothetical protein
MQTIIVNLFFSGIRFVKSFFSIFKEKQEDILSTDEEEEILLYDVIKTKPIHNIQIEDTSISINNYS